APSRSTASPSSPASRPDHRHVAGRRSGGAGWAWEQDLNVADRCSTRDLPTDTLPTLHAADAGFCPSRAGRRSCCRGGRAFGLVFAPGEPDDEDVEDGEQGEPDGEADGQAVELVG